MITGNKKGSHGEPLSNIKELYIPIPASISEMPEPLACSQ